MFEGLNWLAHIVAAASTLAVGFVWYNPKVFGTAWMRSVGITMEDAKSSSPNMGMMFGLTFLYALLASVLIAQYAVHGETYSFMHGVIHGGQLGLMIALPIIGTNALYEQRNWTYVLINTGYWVVTFAIMGGILNVWR